MDGFLVSVARPICLMGWDFVLRDETLSCYRRRYAAMSDKGWVYVLKKKVLDRKAISENLPKVTSCFFIL